MNWSRVISLALLTLVVVSCSSNKPRPDDNVLNDEAPEWVYNPNVDWDADDEPFTYWATGRARINFDLDLAEEKAFADGRADVGAFLETTIQRLLEAYIGEAGDQMNDASLSSLVNDQLYTRQVINASLSGVRTEAKWWDGEYYYVWLKYNANDEFFGNFANSLNERLKSNTRKLTAQSRDRMRDELERILRERNETMESINE